MSASAEMLGGAELIEELGQRDAAAPQSAILGETDAWNPENFAREQIRSLVRRVFFSSAVGSVRQVVFSAAGPNGDVANICDRVGQALALETAADIAIVGRRPGEEKMVRGPRIVGNAAIKSCSIKSWSIQTATNVWHVPEFEVRDCGEGSRCGRYWLSCLAELRNEFEYTVIQGPAAGISSEAALLGALADGIILVLGANSTRKAAARKIKNTLEGSRSRILGTVLRERSFPIPEQIYRRL
jgi:hypothetical protein